MRAAAMVVAIALAVLCPPAGAQTPPSFSGYLTMRDGVPLKYSVAVPADPGPHPVILNYAGYDSGTFPDGMSGFLASTFTDRGYAMVGVNARGTGCSGGSYETLIGQKWADDAYEIVEWIARQPWAGATGTWTMSEVCRPDSIGVPDGTLTLKPNRRRGRKS